MEYDLLSEVEILIKDIGFAVEHISLSPELKQASQVAYLNIQTKENEKFTVCLSVEGFKVVAHAFDRDEQSSAIYPTPYETIYALLQTISPSYVERFSHALAEKLEKLKDSEQNDQPS